MHVSNCSACAVPSAARTVGVDAERCGGRAAAPVRVDNLCKAASGSNYFVHSLAAATPDALLRANLVLVALCAYGAYLLFFDAPPTTSNLSSCCAAALRLAMVTRSCFAVGQVRRCLGAQGS